ncbi:hypothetical protein [Burkholderia sp. BE17]|uniref:hypothetical protein n=1 Tax=Burkholderia sp. BE17 TaxID=2656644 RepID=UPI00128E2504|nr:hypothetical protein [Burkholderia sp. BE17]MPV66881.1 hypothetical protein [Burkholderia sp. BE17]
MPPNEFRYWRELRPPPADVQEKRKVPMHRRLAGLRGMAWGAAAVLYTDRTASCLSRLPSLDRPSRVDPRGGHTAANSKIIYQYLRGEREPIPGARGKYGHDLTGTVHALPGGAMARLWLSSPLWELLEGHLSAERTRSILLMIEMPLPGMPMLEYIRAWARYRLATLEHMLSAVQQERAGAIAHLHGALDRGDPVFRHIYGPLQRYLLKCEPQIPIEHALARSSHKSRLARLIEKGREKTNRRNNQFQDGAQRYLKSGRLPDRRFLKEFAGPWDTFLRWRDPCDTPHMESELRQHPESGWKPLYQAWNIPICPGNYLLPQEHASACPGTAENSVLSAASRSAEPGSA